MSISPQNLYISVVEIFSIFMPGVIVVLFIDHHFPGIVDVLKFTKSNNEYIWALILFYSYIFGHLCNRIGSLLDRFLYDRIFIKYINKNLHEKVDELLSNNEIEKNILPTFVRAKLYLIQSDSPVLQKSEKETADSKFFRSLTVIAVFMSIFYIINFEWTFFLLSLILSLFACFQYLKLRHKSANTVYEFVLYDKVFRK